MTLLGFHISFEELAAVACLALLGGFVRFITSRDETGFRVFVEALATAVFAALVLYLLVRNLTWLPPEIKLTVLGISGYASKETLRLLNDNIIKKLRGIT